MSDSGKMTPWPFAAGEMARRIRDHDWASTPLGPLSHWTVHRKTTVDLMLACGSAMQLAWGPECIVLYNDAYAPMLGERHPDALGAPLREAWPDLWTDIEPLVQRVFAGETVRLERTHLTATRHDSSEDTRWNSAYSPVWNESGTVAALLNVPEEISAQVRERHSQQEQVGARLRQSEERLRALATMGAYPVYRMSPDWDTMYALDSDTLAQTTEPITDWLTKYILEEDRTEVVAAIEQAKRTKTRFELEHRVRLANGGIGWTFSRAVPIFDDAGQLVEWFGTARDVAGRKRAELELRTHEEQESMTLRLVPAMFWWADTQGNVVHADERWMEYTGQTAEEVGNFGWLDAIHPDDVEATRAAFLHAFATGEPLERQQRIRKKGEGYRWHLVRHFPVRDEHGSITRWFGAATDVHELHQSQERQEFLLRLSDALRPLSDPAAIQYEAMRLLGKQLRVNRAQYYIADETGEYLSSSGGYTDGVPAAIGRFRLVEFGQYAYDGFHAGQTQVVGDATTDARISEAVLQSYKAVGFLAYIGVPFVQRGRLLGTVAVHQAGTRQWTDSERMMVEETAERAGIAVEQARAEVALRESEERYRNLYTAMGQGYIEIELVRDADGRVLDYRYLQLNPAYERLTGIPVEQALGRQSLEVVPGFSSFWAETFQRIVDRDTAEEFEYEEKALDRWFGIYARPSGDDRLLVLALDITQRKQAEAALRESEARYYALFAASPVPLMVLAANPPDYTITAANDAYFAATKTTRESLIGQRLFDVFTDDPSRPGQLGSEALDISLSKVLATKQADVMKRVRYDLVVPGGFEPHWWEAKNAPVLDLSGEIAAIIHQVSRVTELQRAQETERDNQERQTFLLKLSDTLRPLTDGAEVESATTRLLGEYLHLDRCYYFEADHHRGEYVIRRDFKRRDLRSLAGRHPIQQWPDMTAALSRGEVLVVQDDANSPHIPREERPPTENLDIRAIILIPLVKKGQLVACMAAIQAVPREWKSGEVTLVADVAERTWDAVERVHAEAALRESEERFRTLANTAPALIWFNDASGKNTFLNDYFLEYTGKTAKQLRGEGWHEIIHPNDAPAYIQSYLAAVKEECRWHNRNRIQQYDGEWHWFDNYARPLLSKDGTFLGHVGVSTDINAAVEAEQDLRESEERFRLFVQNVQEYALVQTDFEGTITSWNPGAERLFGYGSEEIVGQPFVKLFPEADRHDGIIAREMAKLSRGERNVDAHAVQRKDGSQFWAEWITEPVRDDEGRLRGTAKIMRDESERQRSETAVRNSLAEKEELLKEVHHRVKNNLQVITSLLNLQTANVEDKRILTLFEETRNRVQSISTIHELLYQSESFASIHLKTYAQQLLPNIVRFYGMEARVALEIVGDESVLELERAVPFGLLLNEIVSNALKHAFPAEGSGSVKVEVYRSGSTLTLRVSDSGVGLPVGFHVESSPTLGLKLVSILIRQLRGELRVRNDGGTVFEVLLPITR